MLASTEEKDEYALIRLLVLLLVLLLLPPLPTPLPVGSNSPAREPGGRGLCWGRVWKDKSSKPSSTKSRECECRDALLVGECCCC